MQSFREVGAWQKAHALVLHVYRAGEKLPASENFGLLLQLRRCAASIATRIAEGAGRDSSAEFAAELKRARAAGHELEYLLLLSRDLGYLPDDLHATLSEEVIEVRKMLSGLVRKVMAVP
jgi:four helix bundle protein